MFTFRKSLCLFTSILEVKNKSSTRRVGAAKSNRKAIKTRTIPLVLKPKQKGNPKINYQIKKSLYNWIMHHPQFLISTVLSDCIRKNIDVNTK